MITLAILSPNQNAYSETFIQAHKKLPFNIKYYYGGLVPIYLENEGAMLNTIWKKLWYKAYSILISKGLSASELAFKRSLMKNNVSVILAEYGVTAADSLNVVKKLNIPLVVHFHGFDASEKNTLNIYKEKYKEVFEYAKAVVVVSKHMYNSLVVLGCPAERLVLNTYGPNPDFFKIKPKFNSKQFVAVGRFVDKKAPYLTIEAFKKVVEKYPNAKLVIAGDGPLLNTCKNLVKVWELSNNIYFAGAIGVKEVQKLFIDSIAFIQHSITADNGDSEGAPVAILEASAAGLPVISTYHAGISDVIRHNETGYLVDEMDVEGMSKYMLDVYENREKAHAMGIQASENIRSNFSQEKHLNRITRTIELCFS